MPGKSVNMYEFEYENSVWDCCVLNIVWMVVVVRHQHDQQHVVFSTHILCVACVRVHFFPQIVVVFYLFGKIIINIFVYVLQFFFWCAVRVRDVCVCVYTFRLIVCLYDCLSFLCFFLVAAFFVFGCVFVVVCVSSFLVPHGPPTAFIAYIFTNTLPSKMKINLISTVALSYIHHSHSCIALFPCLYGIPYDAYVNFTLQNMRLDSKIAIVFRGRKKTEREMQTEQKIVHRLWIVASIGLTVMRMTKANLTHKVQMTKW